MEKVFDEERSLFQRQVNDICKAETSKAVIEDLIKLELLKESEKNEKMSPLAEIYNLLGPVDFCELVEMMNGRTVQFPTSESLKETIMIAVFYYYKFFKGKEWKELDNLFSDEEVSHIKMGVKINYLHQFIQKQTQLMKSRKENKKGG